MGLMKAAALAPDAVLLPVDFDAYRHYSRLFKAAVAEVAPVIEDRGIDEIYIDLTDVPGGTTAWATTLGRRASVAQEIRDRARTTGLTCSIGVTPNKLLRQDRLRTRKARRADDAHRSRRCPRASGRCRCARSTASAPRPARSCAALGIHTIGELAAAEPRLAARSISAAATAPGCIDAAHGLDDRPVVTTASPSR